MEEHFKNKLKNHKVDWDKEALLGDLKQELSQDKSRFGWKWVSMFLTLLFATYWGWNTLEVQSVNTTKSQVESTLILNEKENSLAQYDSKSQKEINVRNDSFNTTTITADNLNTKKEEELNQSELSQTIKNQSKETQTKESRTNAKQSKQIRTQSKIKQSANAELLKTNSKLNITSVYDSALAQSTIPAEKSRAILSEDPFVTNSKVLEFPKDFQNTKVSKESVNNSVLNIGKIRNDIVLLNSIPLLESQALKLVDAPNNLPLLKTTEMLPIKNKLGLKKSFYVYGSFELGLVSRARKFNTNNTEFVKRLEENESTEKSLFSIATNLNAGYQLSSGWSIQSGLEYLEIEEVFNKILSESSLGTKEKLRYFIVDKMDTTYVMDSVNVKRTETRTIRHYNKHTFYTIPLEIGYRFNFKKLRCISRLGLSYTFVNSYKGRTNHLFENGESEIIDSSPDFTFVLKNRIGIKFGLSLEYPLLNKGHFFALANYRRSPSLTMGIIEQRYHSISLGAGVKFYLGSTN